MESSRGALLQALLAALQEHHEVLKEAESWFALMQLRAATVLLHFHGLNVLTDPWLCDRLYRVRCRSLFPISIEELPPLDIILISRLHPAHCDREALQTLNRDGLTIIGPPGLAQWCGAAVTAHMIELQEWERVVIKSISVTAAPSQPSYHRCSFIIEDASLSLFFAGATMLSGAFRQIGARSRIDAAVLPFSGRRHWARQRSMTPAEILEAAEQLGAAFLAPLTGDNVWPDFSRLCLSRRRRFPGTLGKLLEEARTQQSRVALVPLAPLDAALFVRKNQMVSHLMI